MVLVKWVIVTQSLTGVLSLEAVTKTYLDIYLKFNIVQTGPKSLARMNVCNLEVFFALNLYCTPWYISDERSATFFKTEVNVPVQHLRIRVTSGRKKISFIAGSIVCCFGWILSVNSQVAQCQWIGIWY